MKWPDSDIFNSDDSGSGVVSNYIVHLYMEEEEMKQETWCVERAHGEKGGAERKHNISKTVFILEKSAQIFTKLGISSFYQ